MKDKLKKKTIQDFFDIPDDDIPFWDYERKPEVEIVTFDEIVSILKEYFKGYSLEEIQLKVAPYEIWRGITFSIDDTVVEIVAKAVEPCDPEYILVKVYIKKDGEINQFQRIMSIDLTGKELQKLEEDIVTMRNKTSNEEKISVFEITEKLISRWIGRTYIKISDSEILLSHRYYNGADVNDKFLIYELSESLLSVKAVSSIKVELNNEKQLEMLREQLDSNNNEGLAFTFYIDEFNQICFEANAYTFEKSLIERVIARTYGYALYYLDYDFLSNHFGHVMKTKDIIGYERLEKYYRDNINNEVRRYKDEYIKKNAPSIRDLIGFMEISDDDIPF